MKVKRTQKGNVKIVLDDIEASRLKHVLNYSHRIEATGYAGSVKAACEGTSAKLHTELSNADVGGF